MDSTICPLDRIISVMYMILRIRDLREDKDLKQREVAALLLCDQSLYSKYERGERLLPLDRAVHITTMAAVAVCRAIEELGGERPPEREFSGDPYYESLRRI